MTSSEPLTGVGRTALAVAYARAWESRRPERLFDDPYAAAFIRAATTPETSPQSSPRSSPQATPEAPPEARPGEARARMGFHVIIRTRFYDDFLLGSCERGCRQVVLLAAGLDTRAFRLPWPDGVRLYELDLPEVLAFKDGVLTGEGAAPRCTRTTLALDLRESDWPARLTEAGLDPAQPTAWLIEGLLVYLSADEAATVLTQVGELSAPGSRVSLERGNAAMVMAQRKQVAIEEYAKMWKGGLGEHLADWLNGHGWRTQAHELATIAAEHGRPLPNGSLGGFLTATYGTA